MYYVTVLCNVRKTMSKRIEGTKEVIKCRKSVNKIEQLSYFYFAKITNVCLSISYSFHHLLFLNYIFLP